MTGSQHAVNSDDAASPTPDTASLQELTAKVETFRTGLKTAWETLDELQDELDAERAERQQLSDEVETLQEEIEQLDRRTDLLRLVEQTDEMTAEQYATTLIQHLKRAAERQRERGGDAKASVDRDEAESALQYPDVKRQTIYKYMQDAERLVNDTDVLWYENAGYGETRLKINLDETEDDLTDILKRG